MGSFTSLGAKEVVQALFPTTDGALNANNGSYSTVAGLKIYTTSATSTIGIYSHTGSNGGVRHRIDLLKVTGTPTGNVTSGLIDENITANGLSATAHPTAGAGSVNFANYTSYQGMSMVASGTTGNHTWTGWILAANGTAWGAKNNGAIGFPTSGAGINNTMCGFVLSAAGKPDGTTADANGNSVAPTDATTLKSGSPTATVIFAYGDLSSFRVVSPNDTPIFTSEAISITLT